MDEIEPVPLTPRDRIVECLRVARTAPRPGTVRYDRLVDRCVAEHLRANMALPVEVVVIDQLARGAAHRRRRPPTDEPGGLSL